MRTYQALAELKLDRVSFQGIFVGYHSHHQFLEDTPGGTLLKSPTRPEQWESDQSNNDDSDDSDQNESSQSHHSPSSGPIGRITHGQSPGEDVPGAVGDREVFSTTDPNNTTKEQTCSQTHQKQVQLGATVFQNQKVMGKSRFKNPNRKGGKLNNQLEVAHGQLSRMTVMLLTKNRAVQQSPVQSPNQASPNQASPIRQVRTRQNMD